MAKFRHILAGSTGILILVLGFLSCKKEEISFNQHIRPILNENCLACHGGVRQLGDFSLLFPETAYAPAESGKRPIVPGSHKKSEMYQRLVHTDPGERMPQDAPPLNDQEIKLIAEWIDQGAQWEDHWAYVPPGLPQVPSLNSSWPQSDMDRFVLQKLQEAGLDPEVQALPATLARRVSLDLTGLPPSGKMLAQYLEEPTATHYEALVDSLLASEHYGERWASMWLDLARYADSNGYEADNHRNIWRFRDWVIQAFNSDMPFDQFTVEQLAGDLLPDPTRQQLIATAFHRNSMTNTEGGTIDEEFRLASVMDRLNTTFEVWQSTSIACVQCHSHPYDPFKHEEYYNLMAYFNNTQDADLSSLAPGLATWEPVDAQRIEQIVAFIDRMRQPEIDKNLTQNQSLGDKFKEALFPTLIPQLCDDFQHVQINTDGSVNNQVINLSEGLNRRLYFTFNNIELEGLQAINYYYATRGTDARIKVYLDQLDGLLLQQVDFPYTTRQAEHVWEQTFTRESFKLRNQIPTGKHHLVFELINTTAKAPDGLVTIKEILLEFEEPPSKQLRDYQNELWELRTKADLTPIMKAKTPGFTRITQVFDRGSWLTPTDTVTSQLPATLSRGTAIGGDRLALAQWLTGPDNPLTARVMVNRLWEQLFGTGIVLTVEDFGTQAEPASHSGLLDFLALRLMNEHQWSIKSFLKEILMTASYQQSSRVTEKKLQIDPYNRLLSRGARFRLTAEQIRDQALAVSGLLDGTIGGRSVMPPQPQGIWQVIYNAQQWETKPEDKYRRGLYTYWKRTSPYPSMVSFDSPSREFCVSRRIRTNTPLQALVTLNDPVYVEAAAALAQRLKPLEQDLEAAIRQGYQLALVGEPSQETIDILKQLYTEAAEELGTAIQPVTWRPGERIDDPMMVVANAILNLDGFIMKE
ncbi:MAG: PSD1 and planctomycete cytochrome C domain-containing protein [Cyclobacteriaceae bacterium]|nr:PSD1 and planctomycete cytochrome C domain-containing protein [Cyclobacteriaceae bacterium]